jgi:diketogulonate reductase-like aldo/keto reductase
MRLPRLGMGTWHMGEDPARRREEVMALRLGLDLGMSLVDTAEMYGEGGAEEVVGEALRGRRDDAFLVTKFYPHHASRRELPRACERSLVRLGVERIDCYLCHWRGGTPLGETVEALEALAAQGKIASWGVSNFDTADMGELLAVGGGDRVAANQVLYNLARRGIEFDLLPWCRGHGVDLMAYSPLDEGPLAHHPALVREAARIGASAAQVAVAWLLRQEGACVIPKAATPTHARENAAAARLTLDAQALEALDRAFPPPREKRPLEMI